MNIVTQWSVSLVGHIGCRDKPKFALILVGSKHQVMGEKLAVDNPVARAQGLINLVG